MELHEVLNARRKELGLQYDELQEMSKIPKSTLLKIFTGVTKDPQLSSMKAIAQALQMTLSDIDNIVNGSEVTPSPNLQPDSLQFACDFEKLTDEGKRLARGFMAVVMQEHRKP